ncbi:MAG: NUDIX domain-containing protein [Dehalococcoidia bacterium]
MTGQSSQPASKPHAGDPPRLATGGILVRADGHMLLTKHALGPFTGHWSMPLVGVADDETAEDALARLMRLMLGVEPGPFEFLDTLYLEGDEGERFILNAFTCVDWTGEPKLRGGLYSEAVWAPPAEAGAVDLLPEVRDWIAASMAEAGSLATPAFDAATLERELSEARGGILAAFDAVPAARRHDDLDGGWSALDVLSHVADVEAYYLGEARRCLAEPGRVFRRFNDKQWSDTAHLRPREDEASVRARVQAVRAATVAWLREAGTLLDAYLEHETRGLGQVGERLQGIASHDRTHIEQLQKMSGRAAGGA